MIPAALVTATQARLPRRSTESPTTKRTIGARSVSSRSRRWSPITPSTARADRHWARSGRHGARRNCSSDGRGGSYGSGSGVHGTVAFVHEGGLGERLCDPRVVGAAGTTGASARTHLAYVGTSTVLP